MNYLKKFIKQQNFLYLFLSFFFSELGGFLTNTCILIHINNITDGDLFYLGLAQVLFVLPLAIGTLLGGAIGESFNKKKVMISCEIINFILVLGLVFFSDFIIPVIILRGFIVLLAGIYNPSRQAIVQEVISSKFLHGANTSFTTTVAFFHAVSPLLAVAFYKYFGGIQEIFIINLITYLLGILLLSRMNYEYIVPKNRKIEAKTIYEDILKGIDYVKDRPDLSAILINFVLAGTMMGVFYPTVLPYIKNVFSSEDSSQVFAMMSSFLAIGAICGAVVTSFLMKALRKGQLLTIFAYVQAATIMLWTQMETLYLSYILLFIWGFGSMVSITTYINYVQLNVQKSFRTRTFSILDQSISFSSFFGGLIVMTIGNGMSAKAILTLMATFVISAMLIRAFGRNLRALFKVMT